MRYSDRHSYIDVRELLPTILFNLLVQSSPSWLFMCSMGCCEKYGMLIGFAATLKCFVGSNSELYLQSWIRKIHNPLYTL